jgi:hypothetical protein
MWIEVEMVVRMVTVVTVVTVTVVRMASLAVRIAVVSRPRVRTGNRLCVWFLPFHLLSTLAPRVAGDHHHHHYRHYQRHQTFIITLLS